MNPRCSSCARFKKADGFPTCQACRGLAADRVLGCDTYGLKTAELLKQADEAQRNFATQIMKVRSQAGLDPVKLEGLVQDIRDLDESPVDPFVAAGHDLQPRRRFPWRKRR